MNKLRKWIRSKESYRDVQKYLRSARMSISYDIYVIRAFYYGIFSAIAFFIFFISIPLLSGIPLFSFLSIFTKIPFFKYLPLISPLIGIAAYNLFLLYPKYVSIVRRTKIDLVLPHAAAFCYGMSYGGTPVYDIFKELARNVHTYGEFSKEASFIVRDVELFGCTPVTAIKNVALTTPSENLRDFLENLVPMVESGGDIQHYFSVKMKQYFENANRTQSMFLKTLEMIGEVYVVAFVAVPIFLLITLATAGLLSMPDAPLFFNALYFGLPFGSIAFIIFLDFITPKEDLDIEFVRKVHLKKLELAEEEINTEEYKKKVGEYEKRKRKKKILNFLKNPFVPLLKNPLYALYPGILMASLPFFLLQISSDKKLLIAAILLISPLCIFYELKMRKLLNVDKMVPDLLKRLAEINESGLNLKEAIRIILKSRIGLLSKEIRRTWLDMELGSEMGDALVRFENRVGSPALRRAITLIVKASHISSDIKDILHIAAADAENMLSLRKDRYTTTFIYIATIYISFGTFLYICYALSTQFMASITKLGTQINIPDINAMMFSTSAMLGLFSGLIAGQMGEGRLLYGLKHSIILLLATYFIFTFLMGY
jgi:flagellar protein FlaJ